MLFSKDTLIQTLPPKNQKQMQLYTNRKQWNSEFAAINFTHDQNNM